MPVLDNSRHELFAQALAGGKSAAEGYVLAGYKENRHNAAALARQKHMSTRVAEILAERESIHAQATARAIERTALTKQWVIEQLMSNAARASQAEEVRDSKGNPTGEYTYQGNVVNRALELLGKELGMFVERKAITLKRIEEMSEAELAALLGEDDAVAGIGALSSATPAGRA